MTESLLAYIPTDRRHALVRGADLPRRTTGAALFADISGFTPLTESLVGAFGPHRGAEELLVQLNRIYDALVAEVDAFRGSVLAFSGDAITCWFDDSGDGGWTAVAGGERPSAPHRAVTCAEGMQRAMAEFGSIAIPGGESVAVAVKVAVAVGPVVRFMVGDPDIETIDAMAGETLRRLAAAEHRAERGDVIIDETAARLLGGIVVIGEWRTDHDANERFATVAAMTRPAPRDPWPLLDDGELDPHLARRWLLPPVFARLEAGTGEFLTELRPAVSLFVSFTGIDYDNDAGAGDKLDAFIQTVQRILHRFESYVLQLTIGDKGSYLYTAFGAPAAHEDDAHRAVTAALEIRQLDLPGIEEVRIGIAQGRMRTGAYGGVTRRTYGVHGDAVNISARLMQHALPHEVLVERSVRGATLDAFLWDDVAPIVVKGKRLPVAATRLVAASAREDFGAREAKHALAMVGRRDELAILENLLDGARNGRGHVVGIAAEAGMGKSRLVAELVRLARQRGVAIYGGECQSHGVNAPYLIWQEIWRSFFGLDGAASVRKQVARVAQVLGDIDPALIQRLPLLAPIVNLAITDTPLTATFDVSLRKASLESLLVDCLGASSRRQPLLLVLEDAHWLDALSHDLLEVISLAVADEAVMIVCTYRPPTTSERALSGIELLPHFTGIALGRLPATDTDALVRARVRKAFGPDVEPHQQLIDDLQVRSQGNPFFVEELLNFLKDCGGDPTQPSALAGVDAPDNLHRLVLGRIDRLIESQQTLVKIAAVIGRFFSVTMVRGVHPAEPELQELVSDFTRLGQLDLIALETPEPELTYLFKHVLTQEVAYETLAYATRARLHGQIGAFIEQRYADTIDQRLDVLAHHYDRSENTPKRRIYLRRAAEAARAASANVSAIGYFERVLPLLEGPDRVDVLLALGQVHELVGNWSAADEFDRSAWELAVDLGHQRGRAGAERALGSLKRKQGDYSGAVHWMALARESFENAADVAGVSHLLADFGAVHSLQGDYPRALAYYDESLALADQLVDDERRRARAHTLCGAGTVAAYQGDYAGARRLFEESIGFHRELNDKPGVAGLLTNLSIIARFQRDLEAAWSMNDESLALTRELGDRWALGHLLNNQACIAADRAEYDTARSLLRDSLNIRRQLGDRAGLALSLNTLADVVIDEGDYVAARPLLEESMQLSRALGNQAAIAYLVEDYAGVVAVEGRAAAALQLAGFAAAFRESIGASLPPPEADRVERLLAPARSDLDAAAATAAWNAGQRLGRKHDLDEILRLV